RCGVDAQEVAVGRDLTHEGHGSELVKLPGKAPGAVTCYTLSHRMRIHPATSECCSIHGVGVAARMSDAQWTSGGNAIKMDRGKRLLTKVDRIKTPGDKWFPRVVNLSRCLLQTGDDIVDGPAARPPGAVRVDAVDIPHVRTLPDIACARMAMSFDEAGQKNGVCVPLIKSRPGVAHELFNGPNSSETCAT